MSSLLNIQRLTEAEALAKLTPYDDTNQNTTAHLFLDIDDNYTLKGIFFDDLEVDEKKIVAISSGGIASVPIANGVFVSKAGNDVTGARNNMALPFLTIEAARDAALADDTVYVFGGGTYIVLTDLFKAGVHYEFIGSPIIDVQSSTMFSDAGVQQYISVGGNALINQTVNGNVILVTHTDTKVNFNCKTIIGLGEDVVANVSPGGLLSLRGGGGIINVEDSIHCSNKGGTIVLENYASYVINSDEITNDAAIGTGSCIHITETVPL